MLREFAQAMTFQIAAVDWLLQPRRVTEIEKPGSLRPDGQLTEQELSFAFNSAQYSYHPCE